MPGNDVASLKADLVAEWIHFTLFGIISPTIKTKSVHVLELMNSATKQTIGRLVGCRI